MGEKNKLKEVMDSRPDFAIGNHWYVGDYFVENRWIKPKLLNEDTPEPRLYYPLHDPNLFSSFARLGIRGVPSQSKIMNWVEEHGLLEQANEGSPHRPPKRTIASRGELNQAPIHMSEFREEVRLARSASLLYRDVVQEDQDGLRDRIDAMYSELSSPKPGNLSDLDQSLVSMYGGWDGRGGWPLLQTAQTKLELLVERKISCVKLTFWNAAPETIAQRYFGDAPPYREFPLMTDEYRPVQSLRCPDLLSAIYLQFYFMMVGFLPMKICENPRCQSPFPSTRKDKAYCNDSCRSNARHYR